MDVETSLCIESPVKQFLMNDLYQMKLILKGEVKITVSIEMPRSFLESVQYSGNQKNPHASRKHWDYALTLKMIVP